MSGINPYAAPSTDADAGPTGRTLVLPDEVRTLVARTSLLMILAACIEMLTSLIRLLTEEITLENGVVSALFLVVPAFVLLAGLSMRRMATPGDDHAALLTGVRSLHVVFLIKGAAFLLVIGTGVLSVLYMLLG